MLIFEARDQSEEIGSMRPIIEWLPIVAFRENLPTEVKNFQHYKLINTLLVYYVFPVTSLVFTGHVTKKFCALVSNLQWQWLLSTEQLTVTKWSSNLFIVTEWLVLVRY